MKQNPHTVLVEYCHTTVPSTPVAFCNLSLLTFVVFFFFFFFIIIECPTLHIPGKLCTWTSYVPSSYLCLRIRFCIRFGAEFYVHLPLWWGRDHVLCFPEFLCEGGFSFLWEWEVLLQLLFWTFFPLWFTSQSSNTCPFSTLPCCSDKIYLGGNYLWDKIWLAG